MIIGIVGGLGGGKTILGLKFVKRRFEEGRKVITNVHLNFPHIYMSSEEIIEYVKSHIESMDYPESIFSDSVLLWDEAHYTFEARRSGSELNLEVTQFVTQLGKLDCDMIYTSQIAESQIDLRLRELTDEWYYVMRIDKRGKRVKGKRIQDKKVFIMGYFIDVPIPGMKSAPKRFIWDPEAFFNEYNTRQFIYMDRSKFLKGNDERDFKISITKANRWLTEFDFSKLHRYFPGKIVPFSPAEAVGRSVENGKARSAGVGELARPKPEREPQPQQRDLMASDNGSELNTFPMLSGK